MALATAAAVAAGGMYLDAKHGITRDLREIRRTRNIMGMYGDAVKQNRQSPYYFFETNVLRHPDSSCLWSRTGCYTWSQTSHLVNQYARFFLAQGVKPRDYVGFYLMNSPEFVFAWLGLWAIGAAPAMVNYHLGGKALRHCLGVSGATMLLVDEEEGFGERVAEVEVEKGEMRVVGMGEVRRGVEGCSGERVGDGGREGVRGDWPIAMFFTSGTTGMPKGVPFQVDRIWGRAAGSTWCGNGDRWYNCMPFYHGTGGIMAMTMMMWGVPLCIGKRFSTSRFWSEVHDSQATWITYVGETARYLLAAPPGPFDKDHHVRGMYGNGLRPDVWVRFRERFNVPEVAEFFNSSEGVFGLLNYARGDYLTACVGHHGAITRFRNRNVIVPVLIDQASGAIARDPKTGFAYRQPYEKGGEIIVQVGDVKQFAGYYSNSEATMKKFDRDVFQKGDLWYRTGDALRRTGDGRWFFMDRLGDTFRWKGENVSTAEVAEVLGHFPGVVEANVYGVALPSHDGRAGCAAVYIDPNAKRDFDFAGLLKHSRAQLPKYAVPVFIRVVKEMTPIHNNKQNKVPLREEGVDPEKVKAGDTVLWIDEKGRGHTYVEFKKDHWEALKLGKAQL